MATGPSFTTIMDYLAEENALERLPLLLAGPMLRRTEANAVTVWVALKRQCRVALRVLATKNQGSELDRCIMEGFGETTALGEFLHVVAVTARSQKGEGLRSDLIYAYDLQFTADQAYTLTSALISPLDPISPSERSSLETPPLEGGAQLSYSLSYFEHQKPTFVLPPEQLSDLKIMHGSCRKPHGVGFDALPIVDCLIESAAHVPKDRPHQLFLTGDQVYGDDVADPLLWLATALGNRLLGWEEALPTDRSHIDKNAVGNAASVSSPQDFAAGQRADVATRRAGLTAGLKNKRERATSHLFSFGEYCAAYLLTLSPACWPTSLPEGRSVTQNRQDRRRWDKDKRNMEQFLHTLWKVRRLLANVSTYTIFDDHDVSDDWNLNQAWCLRVLGRPLGRRTVQNAMLTYAVFQAWGNTPEQFTAGTAGAALLNATQQWSESAGQNQRAEEMISHYLGLPKIDPHTGLPQFIQEKDVWVFHRSSQALRWHYTVRSACHEVIVLDTRTWRGYPVDGPPIAPPMLLSPSAFQQQLVEPLSQPVSEPPVDPQAIDSSRATFVVAPTNVFGMRALDWIQKWHLDQRKVFTADVGDSWNFHDEALATLLSILFKYRKSVVVLSGDIHYSSALNVNYNNFISGEQANLVQFTASAIKNEELLTQVLHTRLKQWLLPEKPRQWIGWSSPPDMKELPVQEQHCDPDWQCQMNWLRRSRAQTLDISVDLAELVPPRARAPYSLMRWLEFWNARWFQEGAEVVGVNNIALVRFEAIPSFAEPSLPEPSCTERPALAVMQQHYWFSPWLPTKVVCSRFV
jgi:hypothetical protein